MTAPAFQSSLLRGNSKRDFLAADPAAADIVVNHAVLGAMKLASEDWAGARDTLLEARAEGDTSRVTLLNLALAEDRVGLKGRALMLEIALAAPDWDEPPLRLAESFRRSGERLEAVEQYERTLELNSTRPEALVGLAVLRIGMGEGEAAMMLSLRCCGVAAGMWEAWDTLGVSLLLTGDAACAESAFAEAQRLRPRNVNIALRRVEAAFAAGSGHAELARLESATKEDPLDVAQLTARGVLLDRLGRPAEAADILEVATALSPDPVCAAALACSLLHAGRFVSAVPALRRAVALSPQEPTLQNDLAAALNRVHCYREARDILERLIADQGENSTFLCNLCNSLVSLGLQQAGLAVARRATVLAPEQSLPWRTLANALVYSDGFVTTELLGATSNASMRLPRPATTSVPFAHGPDRKLRVGLLSATLKTHPVGWLTVAAFEALDRADFELVCFGQAPSDDALERRFRAAATEWHVATRRPAAEVADMIRSRDIDVLIELGGWGDQGMLNVCAQRAAPLQMKWVGMQSHSSGVPEIDYFITDRWETPPGTDYLYSEQLLRLPDGYVCYTPSPLAPDVTCAPVAHNGYVTFGCFNNLAKITTDVIRVWSAILLRVPNSRLLLKSHQFSDAITGANILSSFSAHGLAPSRVELRGSSSHRSQLAQHADVDIMLDPFPYSGGLTTCEALWMGVPVLTKPGQTFASRHSMSHLHNIGLSDWVAADQLNYENIAVERAADSDALSRLRASLRQQVRTSPLCDAQRFGRHLGQALRSAWRAACL